MTISLSLRKHSSTLLPTSDSARSIAPFAGLVFLTLVCLGNLHFVWAQDAPQQQASQPSPSFPSISGIYPHLAMFNQEGECGTGAVVPWGGRLWVVTYAPHKPEGSSDKLYEISPGLEQKVRPESIGGTPANRMIHKESKQLFIGPYAIDDQGKVRTIPYSEMYGRPTGNARHLSDPANKIYYASMEEGFYEVDVHSLQVKELWADEQRKGKRHAELPGYHGKGFYAAQGRIVYSNNGEHGPEALKRPDVPSGVLAEWDGQSESWTVVRRNQFTEVTGPGGIEGNARQDDPVWTIGWDHRSLILMCRHEGKWSAYRLPKTSHSYDGAHGWNTEWPRIRDIGEDSLLMTMHGMFWKFPRTFQPGNTKGIAPRSSYLKVVGDFCRWNDRVVLGCDDTAQSEFLNKRKAKGSIAAPQSQSNLWFVEPASLDRLGPVIGRGGPWLEDDLKEEATSEPFLVDGFAKQSLIVQHGEDESRDFILEADAHGKGEWTRLSTITVAPQNFRRIELDAGSAVWIRLRSTKSTQRATAWFHLANADERTTVADSMFDGIASAGEAEHTGGVIRAIGDNRRVLQFVAERTEQGGKSELGLYQLDGELRLQKIDDPKALEFNRTKAAVPEGILQYEPASILYVDDQQRRWRLPRSAPYDPKSSESRLVKRICREVATERDLFNAGGNFYELPAENAGGFAKVRAVATHDRQITDFCSYRGMLVLSGIKASSTKGNPHLIFSDDKKTALWVGAIDDIWKFGKARGVGGPWLESTIQKCVPSDPYLMSGFERKRLTLTQKSSIEVGFRIECDLTGNGNWFLFQHISIAPNESKELQFPDPFLAYWLRIVPDGDCVATAQLVYD